MTLPSPIGGFFALFFMQVGISQILVADGCRLDRLWQMIRPTTGDSPFDLSRARRGRLDLSGRGRGGGRRWHWGQHWCKCARPSLRPPSRAHLVASRRSAC